MKTKAEEFTGQVQDYMDSLKRTLDSLNMEEFNNILGILKDAYHNEKTIFIMGNGGSAATASHIVCDLNKGVSYTRKKKFKMICLNDNIPTLMAYANDASYDDIFVEQLKNFLKPGDIVIGISGSGNSRNVLKAIEYANANDGVSIGLCGYNGGKLKQSAHHFIHVNINDMQIVEDIHLIIGHIMMRVYGEEASA